MADITILNLNMLYVRYFDVIERENHLPLGPLYVTSALERAGFDVDFRDYQMHEADELFSSSAIGDALDGAASIVGFSCMANLLPFTLLAMRDYKANNPESTLILGGVGAKAVEAQILSRFDWVDIIVRGEAERSAPLLLSALKNGEGIDRVPGVSFRDDEGHVVHTPRPERIRDLDAIPSPAYNKIDLTRYKGFGVITSRGCPYRCTFCSVAPIWNHESFHRSAESIVSEMKFLHENGGAKLILFQDEFFVSTPKRVFQFCDELERSGLPLYWKAFGRINLASRKMMEAMERTGCVEIRFGVESGSNDVLKRTKKGFKAEQSIEVISQACEIFRRVDCFYVWGYPFETMDQFCASLFQMVSFRMMGGRILPSLLALLPQTEIYRREIHEEELEFAPDLFPEYMVTGHEISELARVRVKSSHKTYFDLIQQHPDIFPGFFHYDLEGSIRPKLRLLQEMGFYPGVDEELPSGPCEQDQAGRISHATMA